jgi:hypothetical protein
MASVEGRKVMLEREERVVVLGNVWVVFRAGGSM